MSKLFPKLDLSVMTVSGQTLEKDLEGVFCYDDDVIRSLDTAIYHEGALAVLRGNLVPDGAIIKPESCDFKYYKHKELALVFDSYPEMKKVIDDEHLDVTPEHVLVLRNADPQGGLGMLEWGMLPMPKVLLKKLPRHDAHI